MMSAMAECGNQQEIPHPGGEIPSKRKIVILDDDLGQFIKDIITRHTDRFEIKKFADGDLAWAELTHQDPDLLITDIIHPGLDGWELLRRLEERAVKYPILVVSSGTDQGEIDSRFPTLKITLLVKPFLPKELIYYINQVSEAFDHDGLKL